MVTFKQACAFLIAVSGTAHAQDTPPTPPQDVKAQEEDLTNLNLDDLVNVKVTTASRKAESLFGVAAAISVVTAEDIKRSGAVNIPEVLRLVPGVNVAQLDAQRYAVSVRGFNSQYASRLLVLIDGRSIYNSLYGGVYWEDNTISLSDIERVELIRGPGGSLWGANAVNGIINIITKNSRDTQGGLVDLEAASEVNAFTGSLRYGGKMGNGTYRVTASGIRRLQTENAAGADAGDDWTGGRVAFRFDSGEGTAQKLMVQGNYYKHEYGLAAFAPVGAPPNMARLSGHYPSEGGYIQARAIRENKDGSASSFGAFYQYEDRALSPTGGLKVSTLDFDATHSLPTMGAHSIQFGLGYRTISDDYSATNNFLMDPKLTFDTASGFVQDDIRLSATSKLTLGTKVENNSFTGWEFQPSVRLSLTPNENKTYWLALSRAVQTPNRTDLGLDLFLQYAPLPGGGFGEVRLFGDPTAVTTKVVTAEVGHRLRVSDALTLEATAFHNSYSDLGGIVSGTPFMDGGTLVIPQYQVRGAKGKTYGFELSGKARISDNWRVDFGYSFLDGDLSDSIAAPKHLFQALSTVGLGQKLSFDQALYVSGAQVGDYMPSYARLDLQLRYRQSDTVEFAVGGRNLGQGSYAQFGSSNFVSVNEVKPELFVRASFKF
ncbi:MAG: TonB-dependent receptor plug domain-containing protein [Fimbriimonas sp.]